MLTTTVRPPAKLLLSLMTETDFTITFLKTIALFFVLGLAYAMSSIEDDDDDDDEGMYQPAYNRL